MSYGRGGTWWWKWECLKSWGGDKGRTISLQAAVHLGHMLWALMTKKKKKTAIFRAMSQVESVGGERRMIEIKSPFKFRA